MSEFNRGDYVELLSGSDFQNRGDRGVVETGEPYPSGNIWVDWDSGIGRAVAPNQLRLLAPFVPTVPEEVPVIQTPDPINPTHYQFPNGVQVIDVTENLPFLEGNVIKYVARHREKNGLEDLHKARWYLDRLIEKETP